MDIIKKIKKIINKLKKLYKENEEVIQLVLPSSLALALYLSCMVGSTFAWFTMTKSYSIEDIVTTNYEIQTRVGVEDTNSSAVTLGDTYYLQADKIYEITIRSNGTATKGYVNLQICEYVFKTVDTTKIEDNKITFYIKPTIDIEIEFIPIWGFESITAADIENGKYYKYTKGSLKEFDPSIKEESEEKEESKDKDKDKEEEEQEEQTEGEDTEDTKEEETTEEEPTTPEEDTTPDTPSNDTNNPDSEEAIPPSTEDETDNEENSENQGSSTPPEDTTTETTPTPTPPAEETTTPTTPPPETPTEPPTQQPTEQTT